MRTGTFTHIANDNSIGRALARQVAGLGVALRRPGAVEESMLREPMGGGCGTPPPRVPAIISIRDT